MTKLIIIPPNITIDVGSEFNSNYIQVYDSDGRKLNVTACSSFSPILLDMKKSYLNWYGFPEYSHFQYSINEHDVRNRCWDRSEITDWINANCTKEIILQPSNELSHRIQGDDQNKFYFREFKDYSQFIEWWDRKIKNYSFSIKVSGEKKYSIENWINSNIRQQREVYDNYDNLWVRIRDPNEAAFFKLTWIGE